MKKILLFSLLLLSTTVFAQEQQQKFPISNTIVSGNLVFVSGQVGINPATSKLANSSFEQEVIQVMKNLETQLDVHKLKLDDLVSTIVYLKDMKQYEEFNRIYARFFKTRFPTRTCIAVADLPAKASVEISGVAEKK